MEASMSFLRGPAPATQAKKILSSVPTILPFTRVGRTFAGSAQRSSGSRRKQASPFTQLLLKKKKKSGAFRLVIPVLLLQSKVSKKSATRITWWRLVGGKKWRLSCLIAGRLPPVTLARAN